MDAYGALHHLVRMMILQLAVAWLVLSGVMAVLVCALCRGGSSTETFPR